MAVTTAPARPVAQWSRSYPPLVLLVVAVLVAALVLPSALNLPQSNPTTVLEYAPVPPEDDSPPADDGNVSALGLGGTDTLAEGGDPPPPPPPPPDEGLGENPQQKRCVGDPPRQTEDPMSPPCVPFFDGDNFGATYQGVTRDEITVLVYFDTGNYSHTGSGTREQSPPNGTYIDIDEPAKPPCNANQSDPEVCDHVLVRVLKAFQRFFNDRYQVYDRRVHYYAYFTNASSSSARRQDAVANYDELKPFAVIDQATFNGNNQAYLSSMAGRGVLTFSSTEAALTNAFYRGNEPLSWGFWPDVERWSRLYSSYVCQKVAPYPVRRFGNPPGQGPPNTEERRFGLFYTSDPGQPGLRLFAQMVKEQLEECGVEAVSEAQFPREGYAVDGGDSGVDQTQAVAKFREDEVTTVLWLGGVETRFAAAADAQRYYPEIVVAGDLNNDNNFIGTVQNENVWRNAWATTFHIRIGRIEESPGARAFNEGNPRGDQAARVYSRDAYYDHLMLFMGIQVAGPRLTPESIDQGFHAIPEKQSTDPFVAAFFFDPGDFSAVKDSAEQWWDGQGRPPGSNQPGCWRMVREGQRFLANRWEGGDDVFNNPDDPCTGYGGSIRLRPT